MQPDPLPSSSPSAVLTSRAVISVPLTVKPDTAIQEAIARLHKTEDSCILITDRAYPIGIFTERDLVRLIASNASDLSQPISAVMTRPVKTISSTDIADAYGIFQQMQSLSIRHLPVVDSRGTLVGLVTQSSLLQTLNPSRISYDISDRRHIKLEQKQAKLDLQAAYEKLNDDNDILELAVESRTAELRQAEHRWRTLLENVQLMVVGVSVEGRVTYANPFFLNLAGYETDEVVGSEWFERFIPISEQPQLRDYFQQLCTQPDPPLQFQNTILTRTGKERTVVWNNTLLRDHKGKPVGTMSIGEDITERFAIEKMRGEFVAMVSHELRTPLTSIHGALRLVNQDIVPCHTEEGKRLLQVATESSERLVRLVRDILALEGLESGKQALCKQIINIQDFLNRVVDTFKVTAQKKEIGFEVSGNRLEIVADSDRLYQVYVNLIDNAVKFSPVGSTIQLTVTAEEDTALFSVCDEGIGISTEQREKIFERFVQGKHNNENVKGGTGLGLTICQNIIKQHGGTIWVESSVGEGSCFYFRLPSEAEPADSR